MAALSRLHLQAPIAAGDSILDNVLDTGVNVIATRSVVRET